MKRKPETDHTRCQDVAWHMSKAHRCPRLATHVILDHCLGNLSRPVLACDLHSTYTQMRCFSISQIIPSELPEHMRAEYADRCREVLKHQTKTVEREIKNLLTAQARLTAIEEILE